VFAQTLKLNRPFAHLLAFSLVTMVLSLACGHCLAAWQKPAIHGDDVSAACHAGDPGTGADPDSCTCPSMESTGHSGLDWTFAPERHESGQGQAAVIPGTTPGMVLAAGALSPGALPAVPPRSLIRRFCIQLE